MMSRHVHVLGWGFGSVVVETAGGMVFRVPRIANVHLAFERQRALLAVVGSAGTGRCPAAALAHGPLRRF